MMALGAAGLTALSSGFGFLSSGNYVRLAREAGQQAQAVLRVGGEEARATIEKADVSAQRVLGRMGSEVRQSIGQAQQAANTILRNASQEAQHIIGETGIETRHSTEFIRIKAEQILEKAARDTELVLAKAGLETRKTIQTGGHEARESLLLLNSELEARIHQVGQEADGLLSKGGQEARLILQAAAKEVKGIQGDIRSSCEQIITNSLIQTEKLLSNTLNHVNKDIEGLVRRVEEAAQGIILNCGKQGRMLIQDAGQEIRATADVVLAKAFAGQQVIIECLGQQSRLTIAAAGQQLRSVVYEIPYIAAMTAEAAGRNFAFGLMDGFWGKSEGQRIIHHIRNLLVQGQSISIDDLLNYVRNQTQVTLSPNEKAQLYVELVRLFNIPGVKAEHREIAFIMIGVAALTDEGLINSRFLGTYVTDYSNVVLKSIPQNIADMLREDGANVLERFNPKEVELPDSQIEAPDPLLLSLEESRMQNWRLTNQLADAEAINRLFQREVDEQREQVKLQVDLLNKQVGEERHKNVELQKAVEDLENERLRLQNGIEFLKEDNDRFKGQLNQLTNRLARSTVN